MNKHTPGPWKVMGNEEDGYTIAGCDEAEQAQEPIVWEMGGIDWEPNARLIAAAPDLLAACRELHSAMQDYAMDVDEDPPYKHREMMDRARAAIAKAKGE